jgi:hypothetical protein
MNLGPKLGPLPAGAWVGVVGGAVVISHFARKRSSTPAAAASSAGPLGTQAGILVVPSNAGDPVVAARPTDNAGWLRVALDGLAARGTFDPSVAASALAKYTDGQQLSPTETQVFNAAVGIVGYPPQPVPVAMPTVPAGTPDIIRTTSTGANSVFRTIDAPIRDVWGNIVNRFTGAYIVSDPNTKKVTSAQYIDQNGVPVNWNADQIATMNKALGV